MAHKQAHTTDLRHVLAFCCEIIALGSIHRGGYYIQYVSALNCVINCRSL